MRLFKLILIVGALLILISIYKVYRSRKEKEKIEAALQFGHLQPLPSDAKNVHVSTRGNIFSRTFYLSFTLNREDIHKWLSKSNLSTKPDAVSSPLEDPNAPEWFKIKNPRLEEYYIPQDKYGYEGHIWINEQTNTVYVETSYS